MPMCQQVLRLSWVVSCLAGIYGWIVMVVRRQYCADCMCEDVNVSRAFANWHHANSMHLTFHLAHAIRATLDITSIRCIRHLASCSRVDVHVRTGGRHGRVADVHLCGSLPTTYTRYSILQNHCINRSDAYSPLRCAITLPR